MPRAVDPALIGNQLPVDYSPLNRIEYRTAKPEFDLEAMMAQVTKFVTDYLFPVIEDLTGIDLSIFLPLLDVLDLDFSTPEAFLTSLFAAIMALPSALIEIVEQLVHPDNSDTLTSLLTGLIGLLASLPTLLVQLAESLISSGAGLLGADSPLNALNLFNLVPTDLMAHMPISNIGTAITNLVTDPTFTDAAHLTGGGVYTHDATQGHGGPGSARTIADGTGSKDLLSNLIPVSEGQVLPISGWAKWSGLTAAGGTFPVQLNVTGYHTGSDVTNQTTIAQRSSTPPTTDWTYLSGSYTVPADVTSIRVRLTVTPAATAGSVWWDDLSATKTGPLLQRLIAGTDPGTLLPDDITNLFTGIVTNAMELLNKAGLTDFNDLMAVLGGDLSAIDDRLQSFLDIFSPLNADNINEGNIADQFVGGITSINDNLVTKLLNIVGSGFGHTDASNALASITHALVDVSTRTAQLETTFTGGVSEGDDFERTNSSSLGTGWLQYYTSGSGTWATPNGHDASWASSGIGDREFIAIRNTGMIRSATDLQRVALVLSAKAAEWFGYCGHNDLWLRISDATTSLANVTGIRVRFGGDGSLSIVRFVNGVPTTLNSRPPGSITPPGPGAQILGTAGEPGTARVFRAYIGTSMLLEAPEVGVASGLGGAFRRWGHGGRAEGHLLPTPGQDGPGSAHQWTGMDQVSA